MKKLLFGLLAVSSVLYGVGNPGENVPGAEDGVFKNRGSVAVPMEVRVTVLPQGPQLVLVDENNVLIKKLTFDHGNLVAGLNTGSIIEKEVRLMRADGKNFGVTIGKPFPGDLSGDVENSGRVYNAIFEATDLNNTAITGTDGKFVLNGHGITGDVLKTIDSTLNYRTGNIRVTGGEKMVTTKVISKIPELGISQSSGLYVGSGTFKATLKLLSK